MMTLAEKFGFFLGVALFGYIFLVVITGASINALITYAVVLSILALRLPWKD